jgi:hypothetical protein
VATHVLVACVCENDDRERRKHSDRSFHMDDVNVTAGRRSVTSSKVVDDKNDKIANRNKCNDGRVLQAVEPA